MIEGVKGGRRDGAAEEMDQKLLHNTIYSASRKSVIFCLSDFGKRKPGRNGDCVA